MTTIEKIIDARSRYIRKRHHYGMRARYDACYGAWLHKLFRQMAGCEPEEKQECPPMVRNCKDIIDPPVITPGPPTKDCISIGY